MYKVQISRHTHKHMIIKTNSREINLSVMCGNWLIFRSKRFWWLMDSRSNNFLKWVLQRSVKHQMDKTDVGWSFTIWGKHIQRTVNQLKLSFPLTILMETICPTCAININLTPVSPTQPANRSENESFTGEVHGAVVDLGNRGVCNSSRFVQICKMP